MHPAFKYSYFSDTLVTHISSVGFSNMNHID